MLSLLEIKTQTEFKSRFGHTPLSRPKRKGLLRNTLICIGNELALLGEDKQVLDKLNHFASEESEPLLREHCAWAISQAKGSHANSILEQMISRETLKVTRNQIKSNLN